MHINSNQVNVLEQHHLHLIERRGRERKNEREKSREEKEEKDEEEC